MKWWVLVFSILLARLSLALNPEDPNLNIGKGTQGQFQSALSVPQTLSPIPIDKILMIDEALEVRQPAEQNDQNEKKESEN